MIKEKNTAGCCRNWQATAPMGAKMIFFLLMAFLVQSFSDSDKTQCLKIVAMPVKNGFPLSGIIVALFEENKAIQEKTIPDANGKFEFLLKRNSYYTLKISKKGLVTRKISFDTSLPENVRDNPPFGFKFKVEMITMSDIINDDYIDYPIAIVEYDAQRDVFDYSKEYTTAVKNFLSKTGDGLTLLK